MTKYREKAPLDWSNLSFSYMDTGTRYRAWYRSGQWQAAMTSDNTITLPEGSQALNYGQQCFEGLKAYTTVDDRVVLFRPDLNYQRLNRSARRLMMQEVPERVFMEGLERVVRDNFAYVPPYGYGASLYMRPLYLGVGDNLGLKSAEDFLFTVYCSPVGPYYKDGFKPISLMVSSYDRAAPRGTGHVKVGGNYAGGMLASQEAREAGFGEAIFLDAATRSYVDEVGTSNFFAFTSDGTLVTPRSPSILESITRISLLEVARSMGFKVEERPIAIEELADFEEAGCCGTAAVITPIASINQGPLNYQYGDGVNAGPRTLQLYERLLDIQLGKDQEFAHWLHPVPMD
ncbi:branched-chain amino acid aminotransferase [Desulfurispira natronophila]|uniref:Branched-chain-amino-acid aminotransferase n=1 Tax=Desulfurispira natronophila TaxID=682562 RepID=A0A7W7Y5W4_9BACT|nr:branched-chain amino acid aminotransferase [Desulfurispira natronophila]MBB5022676.1 branched-chain amino acid aminotransferase [Desulfurispira natronophila]